ncbi:FkbM family methyltransferase [Candidatus Pelagibacter sp. HIMB1748]|uniref:FkbM family methyltransferase n=1 Tax=unclassified Candidatus Pelagibacter TaxID=2647897 RepID=UPI003F85CE91
MSAHNQKVNILMILRQLLKLPILKRVIPSLLIRLLKIIKKNRGYFQIKDTRMFLDFLDPIDRQIILFKEFENLEINYLIEKIKIYKINYFLDVGANCGYYSLTVGKKVKNIFIKAFEPNKEAFFKFSKSLEINPDLSKKINLYNFGLSDVSKKLKMITMVKFGYKQTGGAGVTNNDNSLKDHTTFFADFKIGDEYLKLKNKKLSLKIDVEGHELNVLKGINKTLINNKCILQVEIFDKNFELVNNYLLSLNYKKIFDIKKRSNFFYKNF